MILHAAREAWNIALPLCKQIETLESRSPRLPMAWDPLRSWLPDPGKTELSIVLFFLGRRPGGHFGLNPL